VSAPFSRQSLAALLLALAGVLALAAAGWQAVVQLRADVALTKHTREVQNQIALLHITLLGLEKHQHAFVRTRTRADFDAYLQALQRLHAEMDALAALTAPHAEQQPDLARLQTLMQRKRDQARQAVDAAPGAPPPPLPDDDLMAQIGAVLERMDHEEARALALHEASTAHTVRRNVELGAAASVLAVVLLASIYRLMRREQAAHERAERAEAQQRARLEHEVAQRTRALARAGQALRISEARLRGIFESATDAILTVDASQTIVLANPAAARMLRCAQSALIGSALERFVPEPARAAHRRLLEAYGAGPAPSREMSPQREVSGLRADGELFPIEAAISHLRVGGQPLYTVILRDVTERKRAQAELLRTQHELSGSHADLQRLMAAQGRVQEEERRRIARELHDDLQQKLAAILMNLSAARDAALRDPARAGAALAAADELAGAAIESTRRIVNDLRPQVLDDLGLVAALQALAQSFSRSSGIACRVDADAAAGRRAAAVSPDVATCLYRVAQESLTNVVKHTRASEVQIELAPSGAHGLTLRVRDNGQGMAHGARGKPESFGLLGMQERLRRVDGRLEVRSGNGEGTTIEAVVAMEHATA
jgi:PAS domain S-box-containing protein